MAALIAKNSSLPDEKKILFMGDSITFAGTYITYIDAYFQQHMPARLITLINLGVSSETASGLSEPEHPFPRPCVHDRLEKALLECQPEWVVIAYGMNDGIYYPFADERFAAYQAGILQAIRLVQQAGAKAIVMTPAPFDPDSLREGELQPLGKEVYSWRAPYELYNEVLGKYALWVLTLDGIADQVVNIYDPLQQMIRQSRARNPEYLSGDGIHPNELGHWVIARAFMSQVFNITLERMPEHVQEPQSAFFQLVLKRQQVWSTAWREHVGHTNPSKAKALPLEEAERIRETLGEQIRTLIDNTADRYVERTSDWQGYERRDFYLDGREGILILPKHPIPGRPWVWRTEFFAAFDSADMALLQQGWAIAYYRISHMYGCPAAVELMGQFRDHMVQVHGLASKPVLFGFSRGGLYALHFAANSPQLVAALYLDAPVLDHLSWPGGKGAGNGARADWEKCLSIYGLTEESAFQFSEISRAAIDKVAAANIPLILVAGDEDRSVPLEENAALITLRYRERNGTIEMIVKPGVGHHPHSLDDPSPIVDFVTRHGMSEAAGLEGVLEAGEVDAEPIG